MINTDLSYAGLNGEQDTRRELPVPGKAGRSQDTEGVGPGCRGGTQADGGCCLDLKAKGASPGGVGGRGVDRE